MGRNSGIQGKRETKARIINYPGSIIKFLLLFVDCIFDMLDRLYSKIYPPADYRCFGNYHELNMN